MRVARRSGATLQINSSDGVPAVVVAGSGADAAAKAVASAVAAGEHATAADDDDDDDDDNNNNAAAAAAASDEARVRADSELVERRKQLLIARVARAKSTRV